jgi:hypothetical protein
MECRKAQTIRLLINETDALILTQVPLGILSAASTEAAKVHLTKVCEESSG